MAPIVCTYRTIFLIAPQALLVLGMKPNTKDISGNFSRKIADTARIYFVYFFHCFATLIAILC